MALNLTDAVSNAGTIAAADMAIFGADIRRAAMDGVQLGASSIGGTMIENTIGSILPSSVQHFSNMIGTAAIYTAADQFLSNSPFNHPLAKFFYAAGANGIATTFISPIFQGNM